MGLKSTLRFVSVRLLLIRIRGSAEAKMLRSSEVTTVTTAPFFDIVSTLGLSSQTRSMITNKSNGK